MLISSRLCERDAVDARNPGRRSRQPQRGACGLSSAGIKDVSVACSTPWSETFIWGVFDRAPLARWSVGSVTLLGDACHANVAVRCARRSAGDRRRRVVWRAACRQFDDPPQALARYQRCACRAPRMCSHWQPTTRFAFHLPDGPEQVARDATMAAGGTDWSFKAIAWLYGHDPAAAVETGSLGLPSAA